MKAYLFLALLLSAVRALSAPVLTSPTIAWSTNAHEGFLSVAFSADSARLASGGYDPTAKVWGVTNRTLLGSFSRNQASVVAVALFPDGETLVTGGGDGATRFWSVTTDSFLYGSPPNDGIAWSVSVAANGANAIGLSRGKLYLNGPLGAYALEGHGSDVYSVAFSGDSSKLASASSDGTAQIWDVPSGTTLHVFTGHSFISLTNEEETVIRTVWGVDFSPDGSLLATIGDDGTTQLWRVSDGERLRILPSGAGYRSTVKFSADGKKLYTMANGVIKFWRVSDGVLLNTFDGASAACLAVAIDGKHFAYGRSDGTLVVAYTPTVITSLTQKRLHTTLQWEGGSGRYQVERRRKTPNAKWHKVGLPTIATAACVMGRPVFEYRVVSLPPKPPRRR